MKEKIENMPILVFLLIGVALGGYMYMGSLSVNENLKNQISQLNTQLKEKRESFAAAQSSSAEIPVMKDQIGKISQSLSRATDLIPAELTPTRILRSISQEAKSSGVRITESRPGEAVAKNYFEEIPLEVQFEGSYSQLTLFMYLLSKQKIILHPSDMELSTETITDGQANLKMKGKLVAFRSKEAKQ